LGESIVEVLESEDAQGAVAEVLESKESPNIWFFRKKLSKNLKTI